VSELGVAAFTQDDFLELLQNHFDMPADTLRPEATLEELGWDSLAMVELVVIMEERTGLALQERLEGQVTLQTTVGLAGKTVSAAITEARAAAGAA
jgi:acyl carrier protein